MFQAKCTVEYRPIPGFDGYRVGNDGSVWSCKDSKGRLLPVWHRLSVRPKQNGYLVVGLWRKNHRSLKLIHILLLETFVSSRPHGMWGLHANDDRLDNRLENLYWGTHADNIRDAQINKRLKGYKTPLPLDDVIAIRQLKDQGVNQTDIARRLGIGREVVRSIVTGRTRKNVCEM